MPHVGSSTSRLINLTSTSIVVCIFGANTSLYRSLPSSVSNPCNIKRFTILSCIVCGVKECKLRFCRVISMVGMRPGLGAVWSGVTTLSQNFQKHRCRYIIHNQKWSRQAAIAKDNSTKKHPYSIYQLKVHDCPKEYVGKQEFSHRHLNNTNSIKRTTAPLMTSRNTCCIQTIHTAQHKTLITFWTSQTKENIWISYSNSTCTTAVNKPHHVNDNHTNKTTIFDTIITQN